MLTITTATPGTPKSTFVPFSLPFQGPGFSSLRSDWQRNGKKESLSKLEPLTFRVATHSFITDLLTDGTFTQKQPNCSNLWVGEVVCVGVSNSTGPPPACPVPVKPGLVSNCHSCYKVVEGDACVTIINSNHITLAQFHTWNPDLNAACTNLEIGYNYCVGVSAA